MFMADGRRSAVDDTITEWLPSTVHRPPSAQSPRDRPLDLIRGVDDHALPEVWGCYDCVVLQVHKGAPCLRGLVLDGFQEVFYGRAGKEGVAFTYHRVGVGVRAAEFRQMQDHAV